MISRRVEGQRQTHVLRLRNVARLRAFYRLGGAMADLTAGLVRRQKRRQYGLGSKKPLSAERKLAVSRWNTPAIGRRSELPLWRTSTRKPGPG